MGSSNNALDVLGTPLEGIKVLAMEQAVALPMATFHLAALGAEIIRVESPDRARANYLEHDLLRDKQRLGLNLSKPGAADLFRQLAREVDIVAHNFTPRVMRKFGIDYESIRQVKPEIIYLSITGFGSTGGWSDKPLFGPGAEAIAGNYQLIGEQEDWPGRPGTIVYADDNCGAHALVAVLAALERRDDTGVGSHLDVSLYETSVSMLGPVISERAVGGNFPTRSGNSDRRYAIHGVFPLNGLDRWIAVAVNNDQVLDCLDILGLSPTSNYSDETIGEATREMFGDDLVFRLQSANIDSHLVFDVADHFGDVKLQSRNYFSSMVWNDDRYPTKSTIWGGGIDLQPIPARDVGADNHGILRTLLGLAPAEIEQLEAAEIIGCGIPAVEKESLQVSEQQTRIDRRELTRIETNMSVRRFSEAGETGGVGDDD
jgi:benzylsuccinate CoA-transferase BbsF subunit